MVSEKATWGFDWEGTPEADGFEKPPVGHYTLEITTVDKDLSTQGNERLSVTFTVVDAQDADWVGRTFRSWLGMHNKEVAGRTKREFRSMGAPSKFFTNEGHWTDAEGTVFETDVIHTKSKQDETRVFVNFRNTKPLTKTGEAQPAEGAAPTPPPSTHGQPAPRRATPTGRR